MTPGTSRHRARLLGYGLGRGSADPNPANNSDNESTTVNRALVWLGTRTKTVVADSGRFVNNGGVTYTITLTNSGTQTQADNAGHEFVGHAALEPHPRLRDRHVGYGGL